MGGVVPGLAPLLLPDSMPVLPILRPAGGTPACLARPPLLPPEPPERDQASAMTFRAVPRQHRGCVQGEATQQDNVASERKPEVRWAARTEPLRKERPVVGQGQGGVEQREQQRPRPVAH